MTHPITPPPELVEQLEAAICMYEISLSQAIAEAYAAGADAELEACCEHISKWFVNPCYRVDELRDARRPKPPSLKEQALSELDSLENMGACNADTIRRALEQLDD